MHSPAQITARGAQRVGSVRVGTHGLVISHPQGRGLLLPHVATEAGVGFADVSGAGLPESGAWHRELAEDQAELMTFCARKITDVPATRELDLAKIGTGGLTLLYQYVHQLLSNPGEAGASGAPSQGQAPLLYEDSSGGSGPVPANGFGRERRGDCAQQQPARFGERRGTVVEQRADAARPDGTGAANERAVWQPQVLAAADYPHRHRLLGKLRRGVAQADGRWTLRFRGPTCPMIRWAQALANLKLSHQQWLEDRAGRIRLMAFNVMHCHNQSRSGPVFAPRAGGGVGGGSGNGEQIAAGVQGGDVLSGGGGAGDGRKSTHGCARGAWGRTSARACRAVMLPHAGWRFCGGTMGKTLAGVKIPRTVIILGPKHTAPGPGCSVASQTAWKVPGAVIPLDTAIVQRLCRAVPQMQCEAQAHREEHSIEVILPFLVRDAAGPANSADRAGAVRF